MGKKNFFFLFFFSLLFFLFFFFSFLCVCVSLQFLISLCLVSVLQLRLINRNSVEDEEPSLLNRIGIDCQVKLTGILLCHGGIELAAWQQTSAIDGVGQLKQLLSLGHAPLNSREQGWWEKMYIE